MLVYCSNASMDSPILKFSHTEQALQNKPGPETGASHVLLLKPASPEHCPFALHFCIQVNTCMYVVNT